VTRYRDICDDLARRVSAGRLAPGAELPGVRELAQEWSTTASTVSRAQRRLAEAGVLVVAERRRARVAADGPLAARQFLHAEAHLRLAGSDDPALGVVLRQVPDRIRVVPAGGSSAGLSAVREGRADGATIHLLHHSGAYNAPFVRGILRDQDPYLIHLWRREQGLLVVPGNPAKIRGVKDLTGRRMALRGPGTGTRVLLDRLAADAGLDPDELRGPRLGTHLEVALAVATGTVEVGLAVRSAAQELDLDFIPLAWEDYELALPGIALGAASDLIAALRTESLRSAVEALGGYDTAESGRVTALGAGTP
jgi:molybdate-binding protein